MYKNVRNSRKENLYRIFGDYNLLILINIFTTVIKMKKNIGMIINFMKHENR